MDFFFKRGRYGYLIRDHIRLNGFLYCTLFVCFFSGIILGLIYSGAANQSLFINGSLNYFYRLFNERFNFFGHFFSRFFSNLQFVVIVSALSLHIFCIPIQHFYIFYRGYILGVACVVIIKLFNVTGIINIIIVIIPMQLLIMSMLCYTCIIGDRRSINCFNTKNYYYFFSTFGDFLRLLLNVLIASALICFAECIFYVLIAFPLNGVFL